MSQKNAKFKRKFENECIEAAMEGMLLKFIEDAQSKGRLTSQAIDALMAKRDDPTALQIFSVCRRMYRDGMNYVPLLLAYALEYC